MQVNKKSDKGLSSDLGKDKKSRIDVCKREVKDYGKCTRRNRKRG